MNAEWNEEAQQQATPVVLKDTSRVLRAVDISGIRIYIFSVLCCGALSVQRPVAFTKIDGYPAGAKSYCELPSEIHDPRVS